MIPVLNTVQMREIDRRAIGNDTNVGYSYMFKAGRGLFAAAREMAPDSSRGEIAVFCGKGNNGGDGYVVARLLLEAGYRVTCYSLCSADSIKSEARFAWNEYIGGKGNFLLLDDVALLSNLSQYQLIVDAMLGTGTTGAPQGLYAMVIEAVNRSGLPVLAADTPSGLNNDTGAIATSPGACVRATVTVTLGFPKIGLYFYPGRAHVGRLVTCDLGYPAEIVNQVSGPLFYPTVEQLKAFLPHRHPAGSKFDHGCALLVCGARGMAGSAALAARAAMRTGCGMVHLASPESLIPVLAVKLTEPVLHPLPETAEGTASLSALPALLELAAAQQALCIGPGLSHVPSTAELVRSFVVGCKGPIVLDADGINAFKGCPQELGNHAGDLVITPHRGEWQRLFGELPAEPMSIIGILREKALSLHMTILLKGSPAICVSAKGTGYILPFGTSALAKAGSGDVLSGIIVSLLAQGATTEQAALLGAWLLGTAGEAAAEKRGEYSTVASDVVEEIGEAIKRLGKDTA